MRVEDSLGHYFDARGTAHPRLEAGAYADGLAHRLAKQMSHALRHRARRDAARLEHQQGAPGEPVAVEEGERHDGAFAGTRRRLQQHFAARGQGIRQRRQCLPDRQRRQVWANHAH